MKQVIHLRFEYDDAIDSRKKLLELEMQIVETLKQLKEYAKQRKEDFKLRTRVKKEFSELAAIMRKLEDFFPKDVIPQHHEEIIVESSKPIKVKSEKKRMNELEKELLELKGKLQSLQ